MFYLTMHSTHFNYGYMASDIWLRTILIQLLFVGIFCVYILFWFKHAILRETLAKLLAKRLVSAGFTFQYRLQPRVKFSMCRHKSTTPSSLLLTTNKNLLTHCPRQTAQIVEVYVWDSMLEP